MLVKLIEEKWNDKAEEMLKSVRKISNPESIIVFISDEAFTYTKNEGKTIDEIVEEVKDHMAEARSNMPDFTYWPMEDNLGALVYLPNGFICTYVDPEDAKWCDEHPSDATPLQLIYRAKCQQAIENNEVVALFIPDEKEKEADDTEEK